MTITRPARTTAFRALVVVALVAVPAGLATTPALAETGITTTPAATECAPAQYDNHAHRQHPMQACMVSPQSGNSSSQQRPVAPDAQQRAETPGTQQRAE